MHCATAPVPTATGVGASSRPVVWNLIRRITSETGGALEPDRSRPDRWRDVRRPALRPQHSRLGISPPGSRLESSARPEWPLFRHNAAVAPLHWDRVQWPEFVAKLEGYRENYSREGREDLAYVRCLRIMSERPMAARAARTRDVVLFLNTWACHLPREDSIRLMSAWIREHVEPLEHLEGLRLADADFAQLVPESGRRRRPGGRQRDGHRRRGATTARRDGGGS
jgi:hypothetical protein